VRRHLGLAVIFTAAVTIATVGAVFAAGWRVKQLVTIREREDVQQALARWNLSAEFPWWLKHPEQRRRQ
jgi:hypothetical protein